MSGREMKSILVLLKKKKTFFSVKKIMAHLLDTALLTRPIIKTSLITRVLNIR